MTDIKEYLPYCIGRKATYINPDGLSQEVVILGITGYSENHKIIPHLRKLESLTEMEAKEYVSMSFGAKDIDTTEPITYKWNHMHWTSYRETKEKTSIAEFTAHQILYLTTIGIAWWATPEMWEKGMIVEVK